MILLADSGATKTDWTFTGGSSPVTFQSPGFSPFFQTENEIYEGIIKWVIPQLAGHIDQIFYYGTGCADERTGLPVRNALERAFPDAAAIEVNSDLLAAARALCGRSPGIACILGTGSNNGLYDGQKITANIGSLGFWMGDEGSGGNLGKRLIVSFLHNELPADLSAAFHESYPTINRLEVLDNAYKKPFPNRYFATFSRFLSCHLEHPYVGNLIRGAFTDFLEKYVLKLPGATSFPVHFTGSVAYYFQDILKKTIVEKGLTPGSIEKSPTRGLLLYHAI